ncbi:MAG TPA: NrfD/PsrC family molybdoenzyme membrane anchor subunit [Candidatus Methylomirabilis sp.]|jgi:formate-dependent nitrite reductase membrane component NrfD|nr:NrfD/PsrC family molybdoenzyme membrane anchor subunit [Candidatus Methylomirabilis sp.]
MTQPPEWPWLIDLYFFLGGIAGASYVLAAIADNFGSAEDRGMVRIGYLLAFAIAPVIALILIVDLGMPQRFFHMLWVPKPSTAIGEGAINILGFHFKPYSPMSVGAWGLGIFGAFAAAGAYLSWNERPDSVGLRRTLGLFGGLFAFFLAAYTGQLISATAQPLWMDSRLGGALFLVVAASGAGATLALILQLREGGPARTLAKLRRTYTWCLILQAVVLAAYLWNVSGGTPKTARALQLLLSGSYALPFWGGAVILGLAVPLILEFRDGFPGGYRQPAGATLTAAAILILLGGFLTKFLIFAAGQALGVTA